MAYAPGIQSIQQLANGHAQYTFDNGSILDGGYNKGDTGAAGATGAQGAQGQQGATGATGAQGISVTGATVNTAGHLIETLSNGATVDAGAVPGAGGYPLLPLVAASGNTSYALKATDLVGAFLFVTVDASAASFTFNVDASLLYGGSSTPTTTKLLIAKRIDNVSANTVTVAASSGETLDTMASVAESGYASLNISATSATKLVRW